MVSVVRFLVGAHFACLTCMRRMIHAECSRCGREADVVDLETESGRRRLALRRTAGDPLHGLRRVADPTVLRGMPRGRQALWIGARVAFAFGFLVTWFGDWLPRARDATEWMARLLVAITVGTVGMGALLASFGLLVLVALGVVGVVSQAVAALAWCFGALSRITTGWLSRRFARAWMKTTVFANQDLMHAAFTTVDRLFAPRLRVDESAMSLRPTVRGRVASSRDSAIEAYWREGGSIEIRDARVHPFALELADGEQVRVDWTVGALECEPGRSDPTTPGSAPFGDLFEERSDTFRAEIAAGAHVCVDGGVFFDDLDPGESQAHFRRAAVRRVLRGDSEHPLVVRVVRAD